MEPDSKSYIVDHDDKIYWRIKSTLKLFHDYDCYNADTGRYRVWNYTDGDNGIANSNYVRLYNEKWIDDEGFRWFYVLVNPKKGQYFRQAMENSHKLAVVRQYLIGHLNQNAYGA